MFYKWYDSTLAIHRKLKAKVNGYTADLNEKIRYDSKMYVFYIIGNQYDHYRNRVGSLNLSVRNITLKDTRV